MLKLLTRIIFIIAILPLAALADTPIPATPAFQAGQDYEIIPSSTDAPPLPKDKIQVIEFFSYGCPWCFQFEPYLEKWLKTKPTDVDFDRIPVVFESSWDAYARAYYTAKALNVADKISPAMFDAIQTQGMDLSNADTLKQFFVSQGVSAQDFDSAYNFSPGIDAQLLRGDKLTRLYNIYEIPTIVIDGKYKTNARMTKGDKQRLLQVIDYLIAQSRLSMKK